MRSRHQRTDLGTIMERDWVTTNGLNVLRFGPGRKIWYNSGNFVFTTANIPTYHKKHKLATEIKTWTWDDCKSADGTVNDVTPNFYTTDLRDYAYYGSCVEMIRSTVEDIISDFPGSMMTTFNYPKTDWRKTGHIVEYIESTPTFTPVKGNISLQVTPSDDYPENCWNINKKWFYYTGSQWEKVTEVSNISSMTELGIYYYVLEDGTIKKLVERTIIVDKEERKVIEIEDYGTPIVTNNFISYYTKDFEYYEYNYEGASFDVKDAPIGVVDGFALDNPFKIDMHHKRVILDKYDNPMRFIAQSWSKYCVVNGDGKEEKITSFTIEPKDVTKCCEEGLVMYDITIETEKTEKSNPYVIKAYYVGNDIVYIYNNKKYPPMTEIRPQQEYIDDYFANLKGFKRQLLRQDTIPLYSNKFITPVEENLIWFYPIEMHIWPSKGYCIDISSEAFETFIGKLFDLAQHFDELWSDNLYRSMTHESIKNFDWTYSRDYYEGDAQDNIEGGERMQKIIRVFGRAFDDIKLYIDTMKNIKNTTYDKYKNAPEALLSDEVSIKGIDVKSTISTDYDLDAKITAESLDTNVIEKDKCWVDKSLSTLPKWYPTRRSEDVFCDVCDNEMMRRMLLSVKRIMQTKGTQQSIEMIFGLFGFGRGIDYEIEEEAFFTEQMIPSDECVDGDGDSKRDWSTVIGSDGWKQVDSRKKGDLAVEINADKDLDLLYYEDSLSGVPMREVLLGRENTPYLVPYYDSTQLYDGDLIFQEKGGWGKFIKRDDKDPLDDCFDYQETVSYLHVVGTVGELLSINSYTVDNNTIYYVANLEDYTTYDENPPMDIDNHITMSHYFILINNFETYKISSWKNIVVSTELDVEGKLQIVEEKYKGVFQELFTTDGKQDWAYSPKDLPSDATDEEKLGTYEYAFAKMSYLDSILSTNIANNPHVGYGNYDDGNTFIEYMKLPFKYLIDNKNIQNSILDALAECYKFDDITDNKINDKIQIMNSRQPNDEGLTDFVRYEYPKNDDNLETKDEYTENDDNLETKDEYPEDGEKLETKYGLDDDEHNLEKRWFINSKVLTIKSLKSYKVKSPIMDGEEVKYPQGKVLNETEWSKLSDTDKEKCEEIKPLPSYKVVLPIMDGKKVKYPQGRVLDEEEWGELSEDDQKKCVKHYLFDEYFKTIIMPYVMQVIPSTTILKLKNFSA